MHFFSIRLCGFIACYNAAAIAKQLPEGSKLSSIDIKHVIFQQRGCVICQIIPIENEFYTEWVFWLHSHTHSKSMDSVCCLYTFAWQVECRMQERKSVSEIECRMLKQIIFCSRIHHRWSSKHQRDVSAGIDKTVSFRSLSIWTSLSSTVLCVWMDGSKNQMFPLISFPSAKWNFFRFVHYQSREFFLSLCVCWLVVPFSSATNPITMGHGIFH